MEGDDCYLGGAVEPKGQAYGAEAAVDVELHLFESVRAFGVLQAHGRQDQWPKEGEPDLTAVGVSGEHEVDERSTGVGADLVGVVGRVRHEKNGTVGFGGNGQVEVGVA